MRKTIGLLILLLAHICYGQEKFSAVVKNETTGLAMPSVHILNLTQVIGTITDTEGVFEIQAT